jgi:hypothetical protein
MRPNRDGRANAALRNRRGQFPKRLIVELPAGLLRILVDQIQRQGKRPAPRRLDRQQLHFACHTITFVHLIRRRKAL